MDQPIICSSDTALMHYGVKGMKWGVRRSQSTLDRLSGRVKLIKDNETAYRKKLTAITSQENINKSDRKRFEYRNKNLASRVGETAVRSATGMLIGDLISGKIKDYGSMSKQELTKRLTHLATSTARNVVIKDALAKSAAKGYTSDGKRVNGKKDRRLITKEDVIETSVNTAVSAAPFLGDAMRWTVAKAYAKKQANEARFRSWGQNILPEKVIEFVNISDDDWSYVD